VQFPTLFIYVGSINGWFNVLAGFLIRPSGSTGSELGYVSQTDPQGTLPPWLVNKVTQIFAPKVSNFNLSILDTKWQQFIFFLLI
jgi:hypothetical protein